jgi:hypothetical protein
VNEAVLGPSPEPPHAAPPRPQGLPALEGQARRAAAPRAEAPTLDGLLPAAKRALADAGFPRDRAVSFTPTGLVAYVEDPA